MLNPDACFGDEDDIETVFKVCQYTSIMHILDSLDEKQSFY